MAEGTQTIEFAVKGTADLGQPISQVTKLEQALAKMASTGGAASTLNNISAAANTAAASMVGLNAVAGGVAASSLLQATATATLAAATKGTSTAVKTLTKEEVKHSQAMLQLPISIAQVTSNMTAQAAAYKAGKISLEQYLQTQKMHSASLNNAAGGFTKLSGASKNSAQSIINSSDAVSRFRDHGLKGVSPKLDSFVKSSTQLRWAFVTVAFAIGAVVMVVKAVIKGFTALAKSAMEIEFAIMKIRTVVGGTFDELYDSVTDLRKNTVFSFKEMSDAYLEFAKKGFTAEETMAALTDISDLSVASFTDLKTATNLTAQVLHAFGIEAENTDEVVSSLLATVNNSALNLEGLKSALSGVAPVAAQAGFELNDVNAALGMLTNRGLTASVAGTALKTVMLKLINPTGKVKEQMDSMGISFKTAEGEIKSLNDLMLELAVATSRMEKFEKFQFLSDLGGRRGVVGLSALLADMESGKATIDDFAKALDSGGYAAVKAAGLNATSTNRIKSSWEDVKTSFKGAFKPLGDDIAGVAAVVLEWFADIRNSADDTKNSINEIGITSMFRNAKSLFANVVNFSAGIGDGADNVSRIRQQAEKYNVSLQDANGTTKTLVAVWYEVKQAMASAALEIDNQDNAIKAAAVEARQLADAFTYASEGLNEFIQGKGQNASMLTFLDSLQEKTDAVIATFRDASGDQTAFDYMDGIFNSYRDSVVSLGLQLEIETKNEKAATVAIEEKNKVVATTEGLLAKYEKNLSGVNKEISKLSGARFTGQLGVEKLISKLELWTKKQELAAMGVADAQSFLNKSVNESTNDFDSFISSIQKVNELTNTGKDSYEAWRETVKEFIRDTVSAGNVMGTNVSSAITKYKTMLLSTSKFKDDSGTGAQEEAVNKLRLAYDVHYGAMTDDVKFAIQAQQDQANGIFDTSAEVISRLKEQWTNQATWTTKIDETETALSLLGDEVDILTASHTALNAQLEKTQKLYDNIQTTALADIPSKLTTSDMSSTDRMSQFELLARSEKARVNSASFPSAINPSAIDLVNNKHATPTVAPQAFPNNSGPRIEKLEMNLNTGTSQNPYMEDFLGYELQTLSYNQSKEDRSG